MREQVLNSRRWIFFLTTERVHSQLSGADATGEHVVYTHKSMLRQLVQNIFHFLALDRQHGEEFKKHVLPAVLILLEPTLSIIDIH